MLGCRSALRAFRRRAAYANVGYDRILFNMLAIDFNVHNSKTWRNRIDNVVYSKLQICPIYCKGCFK